MLCDRFFDSTTAYQGYGRNLSIEDVINCNRLATNGLEPDITFFLDIPNEIAQRRRHKKLPDRIELSGNDFFERVVKGFRILAEAHPHRFVRIDASGTIEHTHSLIVQNYLEREVIKSKS